MAFQLQANKPIPALKRRFATFTPAEIETKRQNATPVSTQRANDKAARALDCYLKQIGEKPLAELTTTELAQVLETYYFAARTVDGREYKCASLDNFRHSLNRYVKQHVILLWYDKIVIRFGWV